MNYTQEGELYVLLALVSVIYFQRERYALARARDNIFGVSVIGMSMNRWGVILAS
jgi:hypothetical protein